MFHINIQRFVYVKLVKNLKKIFSLGENWGSFHVELIKCCLHSLILGFLGAMKRFYYSRISQLLNLPKVILLYTIFDSFIFYL